MSAPIYCLPGWALGRGPLLPLAEALGGQILDLPGYGATPFTADPAAACDQLAGQLEAPSVLVGWSLGALLALAIAARHPDRVTQLILLSGTPSFAQRSDWPSGMPMETLDTFTHVTLADPANEIPRFVRLFNQGDTQARALSKTLQEQADPLPATPVLACGLNWLKTMDLRDEIAPLQVPTLLIHGEQDPLMPLAAAQWLQTRLPNAELLALPGVAHAPFAANLPRCVERIQAFLHA